MAGLLPQLRPFCERIWASLSSKGKDSGHVWRDQVQTAITWLVAFVRERHYPLRRVLSAMPPKQRAVLFFDACPAGGGALLYIVPFGDLPDPTVLQHTDVPVHYTCAKWSPASERAANALIGDPGSQARWEAFAMISAIFLWEDLLFTPQTDLLVVGDPLGVLDGAGKFRSKDPGINELFMELALVFGRHGSTIELIHIWSGDNYIADELSRGLVSPSLAADMFAPWVNPTWRVSRHGRS